MLVKSAAFCGSNIFVVRPITHFSSGTSSAYFKLPPLLAKPKRPLMQLKNAVRPPVIWNFWTHLAPTAMFLMVVPSAKKLFR